MRLTLASVLALGLNTWAIGTLPDGSLGRWVVGSSGRFCCAIRLGEDVFAAALSQRPNDPTTQRPHFAKYTPAPCARQGFRATLRFFSRSPVRARLRRIFAGNGAALRAF